MADLGGRFDDSILSCYEAKLQSLTRTTLKSGQGDGIALKCKTLPALIPFQALQVPADEVAHLGRAMDGDTDITQPLADPVFAL